MENDQHTTCGSEEMEHLLQQLETARILTIEDSQEIMMKTDQHIGTAHKPEQMHHLLQPMDTLIIGEVRDPEATLAMMNAGCGFQFTTHRK